MIKKKTYDVYRPNKDWRNGDFPRILLHFDPSVSKYYMNTRHMRIQDLQNFDYYMSGELIIVKPHSKLLTENQSDFLDHHRRLLTLTDPDVLQSTSSTIECVDVQTVTSSQLDAQQKSIQKKNLSTSDTRKSTKSTDTCFKMYSETECFFTIPRYYAYAIWGEACIETYTRSSTIKSDALTLFNNDKNTQRDHFDENDTINVKSSTRNSKTMSLRMSKGTLNTEWKQLVHLYRQQRGTKTQTRHLDLQKKETNGEVYLPDISHHHGLNYDMNVLQNTVFCPMTGGSATQPLFFNTRLSSQVIDQLDVVKKVLIQMHDPRATHGGLVEMPCGTGKTVVSLACWCFLMCQKDISVLKSIDYENYLDMFNMRATQKHTSVKLLFLVGKSDLINQTRMRIRQFVPDARIGLIKRDYFPNVDLVDVVIGSIQTLANRHFPPTFFKHFGMVIVDEARNWATPVYANGIKYIPCKYKLALDATPVLYSGRQAYLEIIYGSKIVRVEQPKIPQTVKMLVYTHANQTPIHNKKIGKTDKNKQTTRLMLDHTRNQYIINVIFDILYGSMNRGYIQDVKPSDHRASITDKSTVVDLSNKKSFIDYCVDYINQISSTDRIMPETTTKNDYKPQTMTSIDDSCLNPYNDWTFQSKQLENCYNEMIDIYDQFCKIHCTNIMDVDVFEKKMDNNNNNVEKSSNEHIQHVKVLYARYKQLEQKQASIIDMLIQHQNLEYYRPLRLPDHYLPSTYQHKTFSTAMKSNEQAPRGEKTNQNAFGDVHDVPDTPIIIRANDWIRKVANNQSPITLSNTCTKKCDYYISSTQAKLFLATKSRMYTNHMATNLIYKMDGKRFVGRGNLFESYFKQAHSDSKPNDMDVVKNHIHPTNTSLECNVRSESQDEWNWLDQIMPLSKKQHTSDKTIVLDKHELQLSSNTVDKSNNRQESTLASYLGISVEKSHNNNNNNLSESQNFDLNTQVHAHAQQKTMIPINHGDATLSKILEKKRKRTQVDERSRNVDDTPLVSTLNVYHQYHARLRIPMIFVDRVQHAIILIHMAVTEWFRRYYDTGYKDPIILFRGNRQKIAIYSLQMCVDWFTKNNIQLSAQDRTWLVNYADYQKKKQIHFDASFFESIKNREDEDGVAVITDTNETFMERTFQWIPIIPCTSYISHLKKLKEKHETNVKQIHVLQSSQAFQTNANTPTLSQSFYTQSSNTVMNTSSSTCFSKNHSTTQASKSNSTKTIHDQIKRLQTKLLSQDAIMYVEKKIRQWNNMSESIKKMFDHIQEEQNARDADALYKVDRQGCFVDIVEEEKSHTHKSNCSPKKNTMSQENKETVKSHKKVSTKRKSTKTSANDERLNNEGDDDGITIKKENTPDDDNDNRLDDDHVNVNNVNYSLKPLYTFGLYMGAVETKSIYTMTKEDETTALNTDMVFATHFKAGDAIDRPEICTIVQTMPLKDSRQADGRGKRFDLFKQSYCLAWIVEPWSYYQHEYYTHLEFYKCSQAYIDSYSTSSHTHDKKSSKK